MKKNITSASGKTKDAVLSESQQCRLSTLLTIIVGVTVCFFIFTHKAALLESSLESKITSTDTSVERLVSLADTVLDRLGAINTTTRNDIDLLESTLYSLEESLIKVQAPEAWPGDGQYTLFKIDHVVEGYRSVMHIHATDHFLVIGDQSDMLVNRVVTVVQGVCVFEISTLHGQVNQVPGSTYMQILLGKHTQIHAKRKLESETCIITHENHSLMRLSAVDNTLRRIRSYFGRNRLVRSILPTFSPTTKSVPQKKWLIVGIPTVARSGNEDYLLQSLAELATQLPMDSSNTMYHKIQIVVLNTMPKGLVHARFEEAKKMYSNSEKFKEYFTFSTLEEEPAIQVQDPMPGSKDRGTANVPGFRVRKQTRDIVSVIKKSMGIAEYYLFLEDDMQLCPGGLESVSYILRKSTAYYPSWLAIRASYGMNGVFMKDADLLVFANYLEKHQARRPPDHLVVEWYAGETAEAKEYKNGPQDTAQSRKNIGVKFNIFNHLGVSSTLRPEKQTTFPVCYDELLEPTVFKVEAYNPKECPKDDIWPCKGIHKDVIDSFTSFIWPKFRIGYRPPTRVVVTS